MIFENKTSSKPLRNEVIETLFVDQTAKFKIKASLSGNTLIEQQTKTCWWKNAKKMLIEPNAVNIALKMAYSLNILFLLGMAVL